MALHLIHGPPNSGKAGLVREGLLACLERDPILVVPTEDDREAFERELSAGGAVLGATVTAFGGLFEIVAGAAGAAPRLTPAQRLGAVEAAVAQQRARLGPLRGSARRPGFGRALERLLDELQGAGLEPADVEAAAGTLEGSAYLADLAALFSAYAELRDGFGRVDSHGVARLAIERLRERPREWSRPVFLYGFDDLTPNQLQLVSALAASAEVTVSVPHEEGNAALAARVELCERLRELGVASERAAASEPAHTSSPLLFHLERGFGNAGAEAREPDGGLTLLRSAGERGEAEAIAVEVARLLRGGADPERIAIVVRDPGRRGPLLSSVLESCGVHTALDAEVAVGTTAVGGALVALLEALLGSGRADEAVRYLRGPSGASPGAVDWFERELRRQRIEDADEALALWDESRGGPTEDVKLLRAAVGDRRRLAEAVAGVAEAMGGRVQRQIAAGGLGAAALAGAQVEARAAAAVAIALRERAALEGLVPPARELARTVADLRVRAWTGPASGRVRIAAPERFRSGRCEHVFVASLQDGEFPRRDGGADPFLSEAQREELGLPPRREGEADERYLFHACLALPTRSLHLSYRDSDEDGAAEARSPFVDEVRRLLSPPPPPPGEPDPLEESLTRGRDLAQVVQRIGDAPSESELARALAAAAPREGAERDSLIARAGAGPEATARLGERLAAAAGAERATRAPGPLANPVVLERLGAVPAYGGTTLEGFDVCSYRWFVEHELRPERLEPTPDPITQGTIAHRVLRRLYEERPGGEPLPSAAGLPAWLRRSYQLVSEISVDAGLGNHPAERAMMRRVEGLVVRFLGEEVERAEGGFEPWLLEVEFGEEPDAARPLLELGDWALHGAVDRVDRAPDGGALVIDYKLSSAVTPHAKLEEAAKLQLQLYLLAVAELWGARPVGGLYYPLRATSERRPRGLVLETSSEALAAYRLSSTDLVGEDDFEAALDEARRRAGEIVARMRRGDIRRDPGPRRGLRNHGVCPEYCELATICRRDRAPVDPDEPEEER